MDPKHPGLQMFAVWGNPNEGATEILQVFPAGMDSGWHWHTAAYQGVVVQGKFTHTFKGAAPRTDGPGSVWSQPARQVHDDKCEEGGDCIVAPSALTRRSGRIKSHGSPRHKGALAGSPRRATTLL